MTNAPKIAGLRTDMIIVDDPAPIAINVNALDAVDADRWIDELAMRIRHVADASPGVRVGSTRRHDESRRRWGHDARIASHRVSRAWIAEMQDLVCSHAMIRSKTVIRRWRRGVIAAFSAAGDALLEGDPGARARAMRALASAVPLAWALALVDGAHPARATLPHAMSPEHPACRSVITVRAFPFRLDFAIREAERGGRGRKSRR